MSDYLALFRTFDGRIGRKQFWLGVLGLAVAYLVVSILILPLLGFGQFNMASISSSEDAEATSRAFVATAQRSIWATLVLNIVFAYPTLALGLKRRHDRDSSGKDLIAYYVLALLLVLSQAFGIGYVTTDIGNGVMIAPSVTLTTTGHPVHPARRVDYARFSEPIVIEDKVWIGSNVVVLPGVHIGYGSVIGAGSVVSRDIPPMVVAVGVPCHVLRPITDDDLTTRTAVAG